MNEEPENAFSWKRLFPLVAFIIILATGYAAYLNSFHSPFIFDDYYWIVENRDIRSLLPLSEPLLSIPMRPIIGLSLAFNYSISGLNVISYHIFNFCIHFLAALTLMGIVRRTLESDLFIERYGHISRLIALFAGLCWMVHPLQIQSVTYIIQRSESMMGLLYLLTLYCAIRAITSQRNYMWTALSIVFCTIGMATKPIMVTAPLIVFLYDRLMTDIPDRDNRDRTSLYFGLAATWFLLIILVKNQPDLYPISAGFAYQKISPIQYAFSQIYAITNYIKLAIVPYPLVLDYYKIYLPPFFITFTSAMITYGLLGASLVATFRKPAIGFLGLWFFVILLPSSSFIPIADQIVEHRMYLPLASIVILLLLGLEALTGRFTSSEKMQKILFSCIACIYVVSLGVSTFNRNHDYRDRVSIWTDTVTKRPHNPRAHNYLGKALFESGDAKGAIKHLSRAINLVKGYADAHYNYGLVSASIGDTKWAKAHYYLAIKHKPDFAHAYNNLGNLFAKEKNFSQAKSHYEKALKLDPDLSEAHNNFGNILLETGQYADAAEHYIDALAIKPDYTAAMNNLAVAMIKQGKSLDSIRHRLPGGRN